MDVQEGGGEWSGSLLSCHRHFLTSASSFKLHRSCNFGQMQYQRCLLVVHPMSIAISTILNINPGGQKRLKKILKTYCWGSFCRSGQPQSVTWPHLQPPGQYGVETKARHCSHRFRAIELKKGQSSWNQHLKAKSFWCMFNFISHELNR